MKKILIARLAARLTLVAFAATLPGPAAWAQAAQRVAPVAAPVGFSAAAGVLSAPSIAMPLSPAPLSALTAAPVLAAPLAAALAEDPAGTKPSGVPAAVPAAVPASAEIHAAAGNEAAGAPAPSGAEIFDGAAAQTGGDAVAGLPADLATLLGLKAKMKAVGMPPEIRKIALDDFKRLSQKDLHPVEAEALVAHIQKMVNEPWDKKPAAFPTSAKVSGGENILLPGALSHLELSVDEPTAKNILDAHHKGVDGGYVLMTTEGPRAGRPFKIGTLARVISAKVEGKTVVAELEGVREARIRNISESEGGPRAELAYGELPLGDEEVIAHLTEELQAAFKLQGQSAEDIKQLIARGPREMTNIAASDLIENMDLELEEQHDLLSASTTEERLMLTMAYLRDVFPGAAAPTAASAEFAKKIEESGMPDKVKAVALRELKKFESSQGSEREGYQSYLEWLTDVPWTKRTEDTADLATAEALMGESHTGLQMVKDRILEFISVRQLTKSDKGAILAFVGPPGVGKSTIAKAIAKAMGRKFVRKSVGGKTDISELVGHGRTYTKSRPGAIIRKMVEAGVTNPVFLLDEVDKMGTGKDGDPMSALLDILDPEQQDTFEDTYMEVPYDLSHVLWIITINDLSKVSGPLQDRMEIIDFTSYTLQEKIRIAQKNILPSERAKNGIKPEEAVLDDAAARFLIESYTQETGVRNATKMADALFRKVATKALKDKTPMPAALTIADIESYLGKPRFRSDRTWINEPGDAWGLAVNVLGGSLLSVQARMKEGGSGRLNLPKEMKAGIDDSAHNSFQVVYDYVKKNAAEFGADPAVFSKNDFSIAFAPAGPIDGPSAGITMATALTSLVTGRQVREDVAMTGEIDLGGRVHPIGGLKEKVMAAHRLGKTTVLYPIDNESDIQDVPAEVRAEMHLIPVSTFKQVLELALAPQPAK
ncbi:MAG: S16 family serine protease [Elusimicrobiota bacterium]